MLYTSIATFAHALFRLLFTLEYYGEENVPEHGAVIIAGNHPSYLDPMLVTLPIERRVYFMAWDQLFKIPVLGLVLRQVGAFPVRLGTKDPNAYMKALEVLKSGNALGIFPEAGRSTEGSMNPLKTGTARLAIEASAPIVPVTITGAFDAWPSSRRLPWPRKITVKYHAPIVLDPDEVAARGADKAYHEEVMTEVREAIERRLLPSLSADARKRRAFAGPASPVRIYELYPAAAAVVGIALGGPAAWLAALAIAHAVYLAADVWWIPQGRVAKAARELVTPAVAFAFGPPLARTVRLDVPEWVSLALVVAGATLCFNWANRYAAERYARGASMAYFLSFAVALAAPHPFAPHLAVACFSVLYAVVWRPLYWYVLGPVMAAYASALAWASGRATLGAAAAYVGLAVVVALYVRLVKFSAHDGRMV
jgi:1-acyl-sn-glycerol-3-phosphate acyltransferase